MTLKQDLVEQGHHRTGLRTHRPKRTMTQAMKICVASPSQTTKVHLSRTAISLTLSAWPGSIHFASGEREKRKKLLEIPQNDHREDSCSSADFCDAKLGRALRTFSRWSCQQNLWFFPAGRIRERNKRAMQPIDFWDLFKIQVRHTSSLMSSPSSVARSRPVFASGP